MPMQGSGSFCVEAMLGSFVPKDGKVLVLVNGAYGLRAAQIMRVSRPRLHASIDKGEDLPPRGDEVAAALDADPRSPMCGDPLRDQLGHPQSGRRDCRSRRMQGGRKLLIDSMSAFGALPLDARRDPFDAMAASSNKCIGACRASASSSAATRALEAAKGNAATLVLDLHRRSGELEKTGQYRFTPPIHVIVAFHQALTSTTAEGGSPARGARYREELPHAGRRHARARLRDAAAGPLQAPIIVTFRMPADPNFVFQRFYEG